MDAFFLQQIKSVISEMKQMFFLCSYFCFCSLLCAQKPIVKSFSINAEKLISDIEDGMTEEETQFYGMDLNLPKKTYSINGQLKVDLFKDMVHLLVHFGYDERKALEIFNFDGGSTSAGTGIGSTWTLGGVPTSPQNPKFAEFNKPLNEFAHFPNFKYLTTSFVPSFEYGYKRFRANVGVGIFYDVLLNQNDLVFGREWFPWTDFIFEEPFNVSGEISYNKIDFGYVYQGGLSFRISDRFKLVGTVKYLKSKSNLDFRSNLVIFQQWRIQKYGIGIEYVFHIDKEKCYRFKERKCRAIK